MTTHKSKKKYEGETIVLRIHKDLYRWIILQEEKINDVVGWEMKVSSKVKASLILAKKIEENRILFEI